MFCFCLLFGLAYYDVLLPTTTNKALRRTVCVCSSRTRTHVQRAAGRKKVFFFCLCGSVTVTQHRAPPTLLARLLVVGIPLRNCCFLTSLLLSTLYNITSLHHSQPLSSSHTCSLFGAFVVFLFYSLITISHDLTVRCTTFGFD